MAVKSSAAIFLIFTVIVCGGLVAQDASKSATPDAEVLGKASEFDWSPYLADAYPKIRQEWYCRIPSNAYPPESKYGVVKIEFAILKNGKTVDAKVVLSSGDSLLDKAAMDAIENVSGLKELPKQSDVGRLSLRFTFTYNVAQKGKKGK